MNLKRIVAITAAGAVVAGGAGVAIGATTGKKAEQEVLADAAKRLDTTPEKLRAALAAAQDAQLDKAVKAGELTKEQADRIKADRKARGSVLGGPGMGGRHHGGPGMRGRGPRGGGIMADIAKALGISEQKLHEQLHAGKSIADIAKAQGKDLDAVKSAVRSAAKAKLDKAVKDGDLTQKQADDMLAHLDEHLARFDQAGGGFPGPGGPGHPGPPPAPPTP
jgi:hypothetical protein